MNAPILSDALVLFGGTGDLARKKIYPALLAMAKHGDLDVPVIVVAHRDLGVDELRRYVHDSLCQQGNMDEAAFSKLARLIELIAVRAKLRVRLRERRVARLCRIEHDDLRIRPERHRIRWRIVGIDVVGGLPGFVWIIGLSVIMTRSADVACA